jgi:hypothetical protein
VRNGQRASTLPAIRTERIRLGDPLKTLGRLATPKAGERSQGKRRSSATRPCRFGSGAKAATAHILVAVAEMANNASDIGHQCLFQRRYKLDRILHAPTPLCDLATFLNDAPKGHSRHARAVEEMGAPLLGQEDAGCLAARAIRPLTARRSSLTGNRNYSLASPTVSAMCAPRSPRGLGGPAVVSMAVWCSISAFSSPPSKTIVADSHIQVMKPTIAPRDP